MPASCAICGKTGSFGNTITTRGEPKRKGGFGLKITGINRRRWQPNLHRVRVWLDGAARRVRACAACIKSGRVQKRARRRSASPIVTGSAAAPAAAPKTDA